MLNLMGKRLFKDAMREIRRDRRLTQDQMSAEIGVSLRFYQSLEKGTNEPSLETLAKTIDNLNISYDEIFKIPAAIPKPSGLDEAIKILTQLESLGPVKRAVVLTLLFGDERYLTDLAASENERRALRTLLKVHEAI